MTSACSGISCRRGRCQRGKSRASCPLSEQAEKHEIVVVLYCIVKVILNPSFKSVCISLKLILKQPFLLNFRKRDEKMKIKLFHLPYDNCTACSFGRRTGLPPQPPRVPRRPEAQPPRRMTRLPPERRTNPTISCG